MRKHRAEILLVLAFAIITNAYILCDLCRDRCIEDESWAIFITNVFCYSVAAFVLLISISVCWIGRDHNRRFIAAIGNIFAWLSVSNLIDELTGANTLPSVISEYLFAALAILFSIFEYHRFYPMMTLWNHIKCKTPNPWKSNGSQK